MIFIHKWTKLLVIGNILIAALFSSNSFAKEEMDWKSFLGGAFTTFVAHEAAHYVAAKKYDFEIDYENLSIHFPDSAVPREQLKNLFNWLSGAVVGF